MQTRNLQIKENTRFNDIKCICKNNCIAEQSTEKIQMVKQKCQALKSNNNRWRTCIELLKLAKCERIGEWRAARHEIDAFTIVAWKHLHFVVPLRVRIERRIANSHSIWKDEGHRRKNTEQKIHERIVLTIIIIINFSFFLYLRLASFGRMVRPSCHCYGLNKRAHLHCKWTVKTVKWFQLEVTDLSSAARQTTHDVQICGFYHAVSGLVLCNRQWLIRSVFRRGEKWFDPYVGHSTTFAQNNFMTENLWLIVWTTIVLFIYLIPLRQLWSV